jgi:hypothetical protein
LPTKQEVVPKIEKGVPVPSPQNRVMKYPLAKMEVGDSFVTALADRSHVFTCARQLLAKIPGIKISTRKEGKNKIRVWRVA